jgi:hypothetical protein
MPVQILGPYVNHPDVCRDGAGNLFVAATQTHPGENNDVVVVMKRDVTTGLWSEIARLPEATYGKPGLGCLDNVSNNLHLILSLRNAAGEQVLKEHIIPGVCVSWGSEIRRQVLAALAEVLTGGSGNVGALAKAIHTALAPFLPK